MNQYLLTMTACVDPSHGTYPLTRSDPKIRLNDYQQALRYWLRFPDHRIQRILFIENSNYPLDSLREVVEKENSLQKKVEFISLDCNWYPPGGHYGYAELRMLDLGLSQSALRNESTHMIKVSGRFKFPALSKLLDRLPKGFDAVADSREWNSIYSRRDRPFVTTQIILFGLGFYKRYLQDCYRSLEEGKETHMEGIYYSILVDLEKDTKHKILLRFPCNVDPVGFPAHRLKPYGHSIEAARRAFRAITRRVLPEWRI